MRTIQPQRELQAAGPLLDENGDLRDVGWARQPVLDCNLEAASFYRLRTLQRFRLKRWDYYGLFCPERFFAFALADLGYAGQVFAYTVDFASGECQEETLTIPLGRGIELPRNSTTGESRFDNDRARLAFGVEPEWRRLEVAWPGFGGGRGLAAEVSLVVAPTHESMVIVIPIGYRRFYYNRKVNCLPAQGEVRYAGARYEVLPGMCLGHLDWGRGVWEYRSYWVWASASDFLPDGRTFGLNLGYGFGDTTAATENALILDGRIHKLGRVDFTFRSDETLRPWQMRSEDGRLDLEFIPFTQRVARTNLGLIASEVHQVFGRYHGRARTDDGETLRLDGLVGFAEEHHARW